LQKFGSLSHFTSSEQRETSEGFLKGFWRWINIILRYQMWCSFTSFISLPVTLAPYVFQILPFRYLSSGCFMTWHIVYQNRWYSILFKVPYHQFNIAFILYQIKYKIPLINNAWYLKRYYHWNKIYVSYINIRWHCRNHLLAIYNTKNDIIIRDTLNKVVHVERILKLDVVKSA
jgi:hypothetical protein